MTRIVFIQITGDDKAQVDRMASLVEEQSRVLADLMLGMIEVFSDEERAAGGDPPIVGPEISVRNVAADMRPM